jgi:hypothetical protein
MKLPGLPMHAVGNNEKKKEQKTGHENLFMPKNKKSREIPGFTLFIKGSY